MNVKVSTINEKTVDTKTLSYITMGMEIHQELFKYVDSFDTECSGCGLVEKIVHRYTDGSEQHEYVIRELFFPKQKNTATTTDIDDIDVANIISKLIDDGKDTTWLRLHWHSHVDMAVFHSKTDEENYDDLKTGDWAISLVLNKKRDILARIDYYKPLRLAISGIPVYINTPDITIDESRIQSNIDRVKEFDKPVKGTELSDSNYYYGDYYDDAALALLMQELEDCVFRGRISTIYDNYGNGIGIRDNQTNQCYEINLMKLSNEEVEQAKKGYLYDY